MKIQVTKKHIESGNRGSVNYCPIALAINDTIGHMCTSVAGTYCVIYDRSKLHNKATISLPDIVQSIIKVFDCTGSMEPFEFELNI